MKFGVIPGNLLERLAIAAGKVPIPLLDSLYGPIKARALLTAVRLDLFAVIGTGWHSAASLAPQISADPAALDLLLRTLVFAGYLRQDGEQYALSKLARRSFLPQCNLPMTGLVRWNHWMWDMVAHMEDTIRTGHGVDYHASLQDPAGWAAYQRGMFEIARLNAPVVAKLIPVPRGATRLLDLAGSHGLFGAAVCRRHPGLRATVLDLPPAIEPAQALAREARIEDVVEHRAGDLLQDDLGQGWNVALLCNILHHFMPDGIARLLQRVHAALAPDATLAIWEIERPKAGSKAGDGDGAALFFRVTSTAGTYHGEDYSGWLQAAGFRAVRTRRPALSPGSVLVTAMRGPHERPPTR